MDTSDDDSESGDEDYRQNFSRRSSSSSASPSPTFSSTDEENENDNDSVATTSTSNSRREINQQWYKPWSWYNNNQTCNSISLAPTATPSASTISAPDSDATISSCDDSE